MRPALAGSSPLFRSRAQEAILGELLCRPGAVPTVSDLVRRTDTPLATVSREVARLADFAYVKIDVHGRNHLVRVNWDHPHVRIIAQLLDLTYGPQVHIADALEGLDGVEEVYIFGSWAARREGIVGPAPHDIDILVVGSANLLDVSARLVPLAEGMGTEFQPLVVSAAAWRRPADQFLKELKSKPLVPVLPRASSLVQIA